jgi:hypothetical protein
MKHLFFAVFLLIVSQQLKAQQISTKDTGFTCSNYFEKLSTRFRDTNFVTSKSIVLVSFQERGIINSSLEKKVCIKQLSDSNNYFCNYNQHTKTAMTFKLSEAFAHQTEKDKTRYGEQLNIYLNKIIDIGDKICIMKIQISSNTVIDDYVICSAKDNRIIWDNFFSLTFIGSSSSK